MQSECLLYWMSSERREESITESNDAPQLEEAAPQVSQRTTSDNEPQVEGRAASGEETRQSASVPNRRVPEDLVALGESIRRYVIRAAQRSKVEAGPWSKVSGEMVIKKGLADANMPSGDAGRMEFLSVGAGAGAGAGTGRDRGYSPGRADMPFAGARRRESSLEDAERLNVPPKDSGRLQLPIDRVDSARLTTNNNNGVTDSRRRGDLVDDRCTPNGDIKRVLSKFEVLGKTRKALDNDNNQSASRDTGFLFTPPSHRSEDDCDSYESEFSDVASVSSSFYDGVKRNKRTASGEGKLLLRLNRVNAARPLLPPSKLSDRRREGALGVRSSQQNTESRLIGDRRKNYDNNNNDERDPDSRCKAFQSNVGSYESMRKRANWEDAGSSVRRSSEAGIPTKRGPTATSGKSKPEAVVAMKNQPTSHGRNQTQNGNNNVDTVAPKSDGDDGPSVGSHISGADFHAKQFDAGQARRKADAEANRKWMMITGLLVVLWFLYSFVFTQKKPCISCIFGHSSVDGGQPKF